LVNHIVEVNFHLVQIWFGGDYAWWNQA